MASDELSDLQIADLTQQLKKSAAEKHPFVGPLEPLASLRAEYEGASRFLEKIDGLAADGWTSVRRSRPDGDCFYRSFAFLFVERLIASPAKAKATLAKLEALLPLLDQAGFERDIWEDFYEPLKDMLVSFEMSPPPKSETIWQLFQDGEVSNSIVVFLRLLTSAYLRAEQAEFSPFLFGMEDDPRFFEGGAPTMEQFCSFHVEAVNKEADHLQVTGLARALGVHVQVAYLDQSPTGFDEQRVTIHQFEEESTDKLEAALLYRPGHYDCLYR